LGDDTLRAQIDIGGPVNQIIAMKGKVSLGARGLAFTDIGNVYIRAPKGQFYVGDTQVVVSERDEIYLGGDRLWLREAEAGTVEIEGRSREIALNGALMNITAWGALPADIRSAQIAALVALVTSVLSLRLFARRWR
jgi:hypothetical protein